MRTVDLGRTAAQAELLRIKRLISRQVMRVAWGVVAAVFGIALLVMVHVLACELLDLVLPPWASALIVLAFDAVLAIVFVVLALRGAPDLIEIEARLVRDEALAELRETMLVSAVMGPVGRAAFRKAGRKNIGSVVLAALTANYMRRKRR